MICGGKEAENQGGSDLQSLHDHLLFHQMQQQNFINVFPSSEITQIFPPPNWSTSPLPPPVRHSHDPANFLLPPPNLYGSFNHHHHHRGKMQFGYDIYAPNSPAAAADHHLRMISESLGGSGGGAPFGLGAELGKMTAQEIMDAKALAASKSHSEAERRRRERINNHLAKLRSLLPSTTKTDKASLLAEVIQHVKDLKRQTSLIAETSPVPTEVDELTVDTADEDGRFVIRASLCCDDRSDLLPDLIKTLKALRLRTLKAEITTLGGRVRNVLFITGDHQDHDHDPDSLSTDLEYCYDQYTITSIQEALKAVMDKANGGAEHHQQHESSSSGSVKRQRTNNVSNVNIL